MQRAALTKDLVLSVVVVSYTSIDLDLATCRVRSSPGTGVESVNSATSVEKTCTAGTYSKHACTRARSTSTSAQVGARTIQRILALSGMTARHSQDLMSSDGGGSQRTVRCPVFPADDTVHTVVRFDLLPEDGYAGVREERRVERVLSLPWAPCSVCSVGNWASSAHTVNVSEYVRTRVR